MKRCVWKEWDTRQVRRKRLNLSLDRLLGVTKSMNFSWNIQFFQTQRKGTKRIGSVGGFGEFEVAVDADETTFVVVAEDMKRSKTTVLRRREASPARIFA
ncbi:hypothetical protein YC2023_040719 [Brassica napus]